MLLDKRDFDNNDIQDVLIEIFPACSGNVWPLEEFSFITYQPTSGNFIITDRFGSMAETPTIKRHEGGYSVTVSSRSPYQMGESIQTYILKDGVAEMIEHTEKEPLRAIAEILPGDFSESEKRYGKSMKFDLNGDGEMEEIKTTYWERWTSINWDVIHPNGKISEGDGACFRIGVLPSKTRGYHDLVCGLEHVYVWDGRKYVDRE